MHTTVRLRTGPVTTRSILQKNMGAWCWRKPQRSWHFALQFFLLCARRRLLGLPLTTKLYLRTSITPAGTRSIDPSPRQQFKFASTSSSTKRTAIGLFSSFSQTCSLHHDHCTSTHTSLSRAVVEILVSNLDHLHLYVMSKCAATAPAKAPLYVHAIGHALRR
jgi:hypothetical protein